jgi:Ca2+-binding EF-hand superfamily protein
MLAPQDKEEEVQIEKVYHDMPLRDNTGLSFHEFEEFLQRLRLVFSLKRCEEQLSRGRAMSLKPAMIAEFRWDLKTFIKIFRRYLTRHADFQIFRGEGLNDDVSSLDQEDTVTQHNLKGFLIDTGVLGWHTICMPHILFMLPRCGSDIDMVLDVIRNIRERITAEAREELQDRFNHYARNNRNLVLHKRDIYDILSEFGMTPKTRDEQIKVATIIDRFDEDCTGTFEFDEFRAFYLRLLEQHRFLTSEGEYKVVRRLKMKPWQFAKLRATFISMGPDREGCVSQTELVGVFPDLHREFTGRTGRSPRLLQQVRSSPDKKVDFLGFARLVHLSMIDAQHYHSLGALSTIVSGWTAEELLCGEGEDGEVSDESGDSSAQDVPSQHIVAKEDTEVTRLATTKLDVDFRNWVWDEVMSARRRFNESHLARLEAAEQNTKEFWLQDVDAWNTLRGRIVDQLSPTLGAARVDRVLPIKCETGVPIFLVPVTSLTLAGDLVQLANLRRDYSMQLLGVEFGHRRGHVVTVIGEPPDVTPGDRLWVGFEGGGFRRGHLERLMGSDDLDRLQWSMLPALLCQIPSDLGGRTLRECNLEQDGAVVCGLKREEGVEVFPGDHWKLDSSITGLLLHMFSPIRFVSSICAMSSHSTTARLEMRLNNGVIGLPNFDEGSPVQAPLSERGSPVPSEVGSESGSPPSPFRASKAKANFLSLLSQ